MASREPARASAKTLTHAALFDVTAAIQVHHLELWRQLRHTVLTTGERVRHGTSEMAKELRRLYVETDFAVARIVVLAGHVGSHQHRGETL